MGTKIINPVEKLRKSFECLLSAFLLMSEWGICVTWRVCGSVRAHNVKFCYVRQSRLVGTECAPEQYSSRLVLKEPFKMSGGIKERWMRRSGFSFNPHTAAGRGEWRGQKGGKLHYCDSMFWEGWGWRCATVTLYVKKHLTLIAVS